MTTSADWSVGFARQADADFRNFQLLQISDVPGDPDERSSRLTDPFDGLPLRFKSTDNQLLIYSVGENKTDDGGILDGKGSPLEGDLGSSIEE